MKHGSLYILGQRLGAAAVAHALTATRFAEHLRANGGVRDRQIERDARDAVDKLASAAIAFTLHFMIVCGAGSRKKARELEGKLNGHLRALENPSPDFKQVLENFFDAARIFATKMAELIDHVQSTNVDAHHLGQQAAAREPLYWLSRGAITFTAQLIVECSVNRDETAGKAADLETALVAHLDDVPWYGEQS